MKGRKPKPSRQKEIEGNRGKRTQSKNEPKPAPTPNAPTAPSWLSWRAKNVWRRLAPELHRIGLLTKIDIDAFAAYCTAAGQMEEAEQKLKQKNCPRVIAHPHRGAVKNAWVLVLKDAQDVVAKLASRFGLTPSDRARIDIAPPGGKPDEWGEF